MNPPVRRTVQAAAATATDVDHFLDMLSQAGLLVRLGHSELRPNEITGYAVALPGDSTTVGDPVWFGGGKLAPDLSWPSLCTRLATASPPASIPNRLFTKEGVGGV